MVLTTIADGFMNLHNRTLVSVNSSKFVVGLANGWATEAPAVKTPSGMAKKCLYIDGDVAGAAYDPSSPVLRGFAYWDIADDRPKYDLAKKLASHMWPHTGEKPNNQPKKGVDVIVVVLVSIVGIGLACAIVIGCACAVEVEPLKRERRISSLYDPIISST